MSFAPAVMIHGLPDARAAVAPGRPVTLLSAPGAGLYAGCLWWRSVIDRVRRDAPVTDILDCADGTGQALAALRSGVLIIVLWRTAPGRDAVVQIAASLGGNVLAEAPVSLDLAKAGAKRRLTAWLSAAQESR